MKRSENDTLKIAEKTEAEDSRFEFLSSKRDYSGRCICCLVIIAASSLMKKIILKARDLLFK